MLPKSFLEFILLVCLMINVLTRSEDTEENIASVVSVNKASDAEWSALSSSVISAVAVQSRSSQGKGEGSITTETLEQGESVSRYIFKDIKDRQKPRKPEEKNELDTSKEEDDGPLNPKEFVSIQQSREQTIKLKSDANDDGNNPSSEKTNGEKTECKENVAERDCENKEEKKSKSNISEDPAETEIISQSVPNIRRQGDINPQSLSNLGKVEFDDLRYDQTPPISPPPPPPYPPQTTYETRIRNGQELQGPRSDEGPPHGEPQLLLTYGGYQRPFQNSGPRFQQTYSARPSTQSPFATTNVVPGNSRPDSSLPSQPYYGPSSLHQTEHEYRPDNPFQSPFRPPVINFDEPRYLPGFPGSPPPVAFSPVQQTRSPPFQGLQNDVRSGYPSNVPQPAVLGSNPPQFQRDDFFSRPPPSTFPGFIFRDIPNGGFPSSSSDHQPNERFVEFRGPSPLEQRPFGPQQQDSNITVSHQYPTVQSSGQPIFNSFGNPESSPSVGPSFQSTHLPFFANSRPDDPIGPPNNFFSSFSNAIQPFNIFTGYQNPAHNQNGAMEEAIPKEPQQQSEESESVSEKREPKQDQKSQDPEQNQKNVREAPFGSRLTPTISSVDSPFYISPLQQVEYSNQREPHGRNSTSSEETGNTEPSTSSLLSGGDVFPGPRHQHSPPDIRGHSSPPQGDKPLYSRLSSIRGPFQETSNYHNNGPSPQNTTSPVHSFFGSAPFRTPYDSPSVSSSPPQRNIFDAPSGRPQFLRNPLPDRIFSSPLVDTRISRRPFGSNELRPSSPEIGGHRNNGYHYFNLGDQARNSQEINEIPVCAQKANVSICFEDTVYPRSEILHSVESDRYLADRLLISPAQTSRSSLVEGSEEIGDSDQTENYVCKSLVKYGQPKRARNSDGYWKILVNLEDDVAGGKLSQPVRLEVCSNPGTGCSHTSNSVSTQCVQKYNFHRLVVWTPGRGLSMDIFKLPVACSCQVNTKD